MSESGIRFWLFINNSTTTTTTAYTRQFRRHSSSFFNGIISTKKYIEENFFFQNFEWNNYFYFFFGCHYISNTVFRHTHTNANRPDPTRSPSNLANHNVSVRERVSVYTLVSWLAGWLAGRINFIIRLFLCVCMCLFVYILLWRVYVCCVGSFQIYFNQPTTPKKRWKLRESVIG